MSTQSLAPLLLLHGFPLDGRMWRHTVARFQTEREVIAPDVRDLLAGLKPRTVAGLAQAAARLIGDRRAVVCGLSMGGYIAQQFAHAYPDRLSGLVLCDTLATADTAEVKANRNKMMEAVREKGVPAGVKPLVERLMHAPSPALRAEVDTIVAAQSVETICGCIEALRDRGDNTGFLPSISVPALIVAGEQDAMCPADVVHGLAAAIPNAALAFIPNSGHVPPMENPEAFNEALARFLRRVDETA